MESSKSHNDLVEIRDSLNMTAKFDHDVEYFIEHVPGITLNDIYSSVGGQMGLFLGASLLTIMEMGEHVVCLLWTAATHRCFRSQKDVTTALQD
ncbi:hypothetical protein ACOMHN_047448 [Nucella lapillus]